MKWFSTLTVLWNSVLLTLYCHLVDGPGWHVQLRIVKVIHDIVKAILVKCCVGSYQHLRHVVIDTDKVWCHRERWMINTFSREHHQLLLFIHLQHMEQRTCEQWHQKLVATWSCFYYLYLLFLLNTVSLVTYLTELINLPKQFQKWNHNSTNTKSKRSKLIPIMWWYDYQIQRIKRK